MREGHQVHVEDECRMGRDVGLLAAAIGKMGRDVDTPYIALRHVLQRSAPPYDDTSHAKLGRHIGGRVELALV